MRESKEKQYQIQVDTLERMGPVQLGPTTSHGWRSDPRRLTFQLARYKFVSKMLAGRERALEVGCGDGFGMRIVLQTVKHVHGIDFDPIFIDWATEHAASEGLNGSFSCQDVLETSLGGPYQAAYSLDLIEHLEPGSEPRYWEHVVEALDPHGVFIVGTPNATAAPHASIWSQEGHINLQTGDQLQGTMLRYFHNAFLFSMNDEVVHTGFTPMAHYLFAMGVGVRS